ncbi:MAG: hypothetical protein JWP69_2244 [Flaviaesturariibacter sp.]|nr:hypothetical protein [Flaviaesturariibacter sp.]
MGDKTAPFVEKVTEYVTTNPEFVPGFMSAEELQVDFGNIKGLFPLTNLLQQVYDNAADTAMVSGSEAYTAALMYYNSVQRAAEQGIPGARAIADDLKQRFPSRQRKAAAPDAPPLQPQQQS